MYQRVCVCTCMCACISLLCCVWYFSYVVKQGKEHAHQPVKALLQHVCFKTPDKAEYRTKLAKVSVYVHFHIPCNVYKHICDWAAKINHVSVNYAKLYFC